MVCYCRLFALEGREEIMGVNIEEFVSVFNVLGNRPLGLLLSLLFLLFNFFQVTSEHLKNKKKIVLTSYLFQFWEKNNSFRKGDGQILQMLAA